MQGTLSFVYNGTIDDNERILQTLIHRSEEIHYEQFPLNVALENTLTFLDRLIFVKGKYSGCSRMNPGSSSNDLKIETVTGEIFRKNISILDSEFHLWRFTAIEDMKSADVSAYVLKQKPPKRSASKRHKPASENSEFDDELKALVPDDSIRRSIHQLIDKHFSIYKKKSS